jgi:hypothetical protein
MYIIGMDSIDTLCNIRFNLDEQLDILKQSSTYDEFRLKLDLADNVCIITREEYEHIKESI